jgi:flagellar biosynthesis/type III secretory pathway protein FliH
MNEILFKGASWTARNAKLDLVVREVPKAQPVNDDRDVTIDRLTAERDELRRKLDELEQSWQQRSDELRDEAHKAAEQEFARDDHSRILTLTTGIESAIAAFEVQLANYATGLTPRLAQHALNQLVKVRKDEADWLSRAIERRLDSLSSHAVVAIVLASDDVSEDILATVSKRFRSKAEVTTDPTLKPGTARIILRMGEIQIDPQHGLEQLVAMLGDGA